MKTLIIALNSKYIHSSLAPWYLKAACNDLCGEVKVVEYTINENPDSILAAIYAEKADVAAFSCYIWNIGQILRISENLKKIQSHIITVFGGPEVSYDSVDLLHEFPYIDYVISGEGEKPLPRLLEHLYQKHTAASRKNSGFRIQNSELKREFYPLNIGTTSFQQKSLLKKQTFLEELYMKSPCSNGNPPADCHTDAKSGEFRDPLPMVENAEFTSQIPDKLKEIAGLTYRNGDAVKSNPADLPPSLTEIPSPYTKEMLTAIKGKIAYFEASRGCPFSCSYCLSSADEGVRFFPLERVKEEMKAVLKAGVRQVKFVDRTFNCNKVRAKELLKFVSYLQSENSRSYKVKNGHEESGDKIYSNDQKSSSDLTNFHFEAAADLFDDELINILADMPKGLIQLEIGIQSTNRKTLEAVKRKTDIDEAFKNIKRIMEAGNIHLHLDLIAGLPYEDLESFKESFNSVYSLKPHALQLGFLKLLKGSPVRNDSRQHGYVFRDYAPYEVLSNSYISYDELTLLKSIEEILDRYWNSGRFTISLDYLIHNYFSSAFDFYLDFYKFNMKMNKSIQSVSGRDLIPLLQEFAKSVEGIDLASFKEYLKLDFLASDSSGHLPASLARLSTHGFNDKCHEFLKNQTNLAAFLPAFAGLPARQIIKNVHFELISIDEYGNTNDQSAFIYLFDYSVRDSITGRYKFHIIDNF